MEVRFEINNRAELRQLLDMDNDDLKDIVSYDLEASEVAKIVDRYGVLFESGSMPVVLEPWHPLDDRPDQVHTNRELALMLAGSKPLAAFVDVHPSVDGAFGIPEREFEPHVASGLIVKRDVIEPPSADERPIEGLRRGTRLVLYALKGEEWRINAYLLLRRTAAKSGWNEGFERMEGSLLGYEDWQNDVQIDEQKNRKKADPD